MSKRVDAMAQCGRCAQRYQVTVFCSIWGEYPENRALVFEDRINILRCPACDLVTRAPSSLIYTNRERGFAVWYEPVPPDPVIEKDTQFYAAAFSPPDNFYSTAPRVQDWEEFKATILQFERGERWGKPATPAPPALAQMSRALVLAGRASKRGCLLPILLPLLALGLAIVRF